MTTRAGRTIGPLVDVAPARRAVVERALQARYGERVPPGLAQIVAERVEVADAGSFDVVRPADWELLLTRNAAAPLWAAIWPSAIVLAHALARAGRAHLAGRRALELGAGLALPSMVAEALGAHVTATDGDADAVCFAAANVATARPLALRDASARDHDVLLAADVLHDRDNVAPLLTVLDALVERGGEAWISDPGRPSAEALRAYAQPQQHGGGVLLFVISGRTPDAAG